MSYFINNDLIKNVSFVDEYLDAHSVFFKSEHHFPQKSLKENQCNLCCMSNGYSSPIVAICYNKQQIEKFENDSRDKVWYAIESLEVAKHSPEFRDFLMKKVYSNGSNLKEIYDDEDYNFNY